MPWTPDPTKLICEFQVPKTRTWGSEDDEAFKKEVLAAAVKAGLQKSSANQYGFVIDVAFPASLRGKKRQEPDVENVPKLVIDAFTGYLYPDDNINYVRAVHVCGQWSEGPGASTGVKIYAM
jgi:Holliday junction resolvase RusA-like endonuclease